MDSAVALALMAKAKLVFERDDTFLSFPLTPLAYTKDQLSFMSRDLTVEGLSALQQFSQLVDLVPMGVVWPPSDPRFLSDVYRDVLLGAKLASSTRTPEEEADYQKAMRFLYDFKPDGFREPTPAFTAYQQYRDLMYAAQQSYTNKKIEAEYSKDEAVKQRWREVEDPTLRAQLSDLNSDWTAKGYKAQVEEARHIAETLGAKSPALMWEQWKRQFMPDIDQVTDAKTNQAVFPSGFSPSNVLETGGWQRFTLTEDETHGLVGRAPAELRTRFGSDQLDLDITSLSFEYSSVKVERAWLAPDVFKASFWRFYDGSKILSDGRSLSVGICPSYVAALVFARNLHVTLNPRSSKNTELLTQLHAKPGLSVATFHVAASRTGVTAAKATTLRSSPVSPATVVAKPVAAGSFTAVSMPAARVATTMPSPKAMAGPSSATLGAGGNVAVARLRSQSVTRVAAPSRWTTLPAPPTTPAKPPVPPPEPPDDDIYIVALICKRLPMSPNPDAALQW